MIKRVVEISNEASLKFKNGSLVVSKKEQQTVSVPLEDLGILITDNQCISYSHRLLLECAIHNVALVICDLKHLPTALMLPSQSNHLHAKVVREQANLKGATAGCIWKHIIRAKIAQQAETVRSIGQDPSRIKVLAKRVRLHDTANIEALSARRYWGLLFGKEFRRDRESPGINSLLNYGYAILRAAVARAIVGTGMHPALGIKHCSPTNAFCLADDLMEPLRPVVDREVYRIEIETEELPEETPRSFAEKKRDVLQIINREISVNDRVWPFFPGIQVYVASVKEAIISNSIKLLKLPKVLM